MTRHLTVLVVDDCEDDCFLVLRALQRGGFEPDWARVQDERGLRAALKRRRWKVVILDNSMPGFDGTRALELVRSLAPEAIAIFVSGSLGDEQAIEFMRLGASDYILKDRIGRLPAAVSRELMQSDERRARVEAERKVVYMARHDGVTGLGNRTVIEEQIGHRLAAQVQNEPFAVIVIALEQFARIDRAFGREVGEEVLRLAARRLEAACPNGGTLVSLGNDDFGFVLPGADKSYAIECAEGLRRSLDEPVILGGLPIQLESNAGIALHPGHGDHASLLLRSAAMALHEVRRTGWGVGVFDRSREQFDPDELSLLGELRAAIEQGQLTLEYQPIIDLALGMPVAVEALVRWDHPRRGRIPPGSFVPQAENSGLAYLLTMDVLRSALAWCRQQSDEGRPLSVAVNFSTHNLLDPRILSSISDALDSAGVSPSLLEVEITESSLMSDPSRARNVLEQLRKSGVRLAIDDFGTGYSSFAYLRDLPVHKVKIDRTFVAGMASSESDCLIVRGIIDLAHTLKLKVVAEGVEDELTLNLLEAFGCDDAQGYHLGHPMTASKLRTWMSGWRVRTARSQPALGMKRSV